MAFNEPGRRFKRKNGKRKYNGLNSNARHDPPVISRHYSLREVAAAAGLRYKIARTYASQGIIASTRRGLGVYRVTARELRRVVKRYRR